MTNAQVIIVMVQMFVTQRVMCAGRLHGPIDREILPLMSPRSPRHSSWSAYSIERSMCDELRQPHSRKMSVVRYATLYDDRNVPNISLRPSNIYRPYPQCLSTLHIYTSKTFKVHAIENLFLPPVVSYIGNLLIDFFCGIFMAKWQSWYFWPTVKCLAQICQRTHIAGTLGEFWHMHLWANRSITNSTLTGKWLLNVFHWHHAVNRLAMELSHSYHSRSTHFAVLYLIIHDYCEYSDGQGVTQRLIIRRIPRYIGHRTG